MTEYQGLQTPRFQRSRSGHRRL